MKNIGEDIDKSDVEGSLWHDIGVNICGNAFENVGKGIWDDIKRNIWFNIHIPIYQNIKIPSRQALKKQNK